MKSFRIQELKSNPSKALVAAKNEPVLIANNGEPELVIISYEYFKDLTSRNKNGLELFAQLDWPEEELEAHPKVRQREVGF